MSPEQVHTHESVRAELKWTEASVWAVGQATHPPEEAKEMFCWSLELLRAGSARFSVREAQGFRQLSLLLPDREVKDELKWTKKGGTGYPTNKNDKIYFPSDAKQ